MADAHGTAVELFYDGSWQAAPALQGTVIRTTVGAPGEGQESPPNAVTLELKDTAGLYVPTNPTSALYGLAGRNTPLRVVSDGSTRAHVEASVWRPTRSLGGHKRTGLTGGGLLRRVQQGQTPLRSPAYRALTAAENDSVRVAYWPLEEEAGAASVFAPYGGSVSLDGPGSFTFGALPSASAARLGRFDSFDTFLTVRPPAWTASGEVFVAATFRFPAAGLTDGAVIWRLYFTGGTIDFVDLYWQTGDALTLLVYTGGVLVGSIAGADWTGYIDDREVVLINTFDQNGANIDMRVRGTTAGNWLVESSGTLASRTLGTLYQMVVGTGPGVNGLGFGSLVIGRDKDAFGNYINDLDSDVAVTVTGARGYAGERAGQRFLRLCGEEGIACDVVGDPDDTQRMGPQRTLSFVDNLRECVRTDAGLMFDAVDDRALIMRTGRSLYNQAAAMTLSYTGGHLATSPELAPVFDDQATRNDVTATNVNGASANVVRASGPLNISDPLDDPLGVGRVDTEIKVNLFSDAVLIDRAGVELARGTVDEPRYPSITVDLDRGSSLVSAANALRPGDRVAVTNLPAEWSPDGASLLVPGWSESIPPNRRLMTLVCVPASPYEIGIVGANDGSTDLRAAAVDSDQLTLVSGVSSSAGSLSVAAAGGVTITTDANDWNASRNGGPLYIVVGGEKMTVTNITGTGPWTISVTRSVNGIVKAHSAGDAVHAWQPVRIGF